DDTGLVDGAIGGRGHRVAFSDDAGARLEGAGKEVVEVLELQRLATLGLGPVHLIALNEPADEGIFDKSALAVGQTADQPGDQMLRHQVLHDDEKTSVHGESAITKGGTA